MSKVIATPPGEGDSTQPTIEELQEALSKAEKRAKDNQAAYTRGQQELSRLKAEKDELLKQTPSSEASLDPEEKARLDQLKKEDPDAWYLEKQKIDEAHRKQVQDNLKAVSDAAASKTELERRAEVLDTFIKENPDLALDDDIIANDIPPRITNKLESNEVTFEEFLDEVKEYIESGTKVHPGEGLGERQPNLGKASGGGAPDEGASDKQTELDYKKMTF